MCADLETMHFPAIIASGRMEMLPKQDELLWTTACWVLVTPFDAHELLTAVEAALGPSPAARAFDTYVDAVRSLAPSAKAMVSDRAIGIAH